MMAHQSQSPTPLVFDRTLLRRRRDRAASTLGGVDFLIRHVAEQLAERLDDVRRRFPLALEVGAHTGQLAAALEGRGGMEHAIRTDLSPAMIGRAHGSKVVADEEALPFGAERFDLVLSSFVLHWVNDLPGTLAQIRYTLKPDGLFLAAMPGGRTLFELRESLMCAELEHTGGAGARVSPFVDVPDAGALLQRAGFALPVVDLDTLRVTYDHPLKLIEELRAMGEASALAARDQKPLSRAILMRAAEIYVERFADGRGRVPATFQILTLTGWKPDPSQPQPKRRGSGRVDLARALAPETGAEDQSR